ncbi:MAG: alcohol dehydrogenase catalytic domain-containing protein [Rectinemataceae bacterium]|nr:alcohol dehydrogenase catalytic domain-containing protein [Rectinemataceae bacterium]
MTEETGSADSADGPSMEAYVLKTFGAALKQCIVPIPQPGEGEILLRVRACGICGTDLKITAGHLKHIVHLPHVPGHEIAGDIAALGPGVDTLFVGQRGAVYFYLPCGDCEPCRAGRENICVNVRRLGFEEWGGFAEYVALPARNFCPARSDTPYETLAVIPDALLTSYHAVMTAGATQAGQRVLIIGAGGLGLHAVQFARLAGASVAVCDPRPAARALAGKLGAELQLPSLDEGDSRHRDARGYDLIIEGSGSPEVFPKALNCLARGGRLVIMGYHTVTPYSLDSMAMHYNEWSVCGSRVGTRAELTIVMDLVESGKVRSIIDRVLPLSDVNEGLELLRGSSILGRIVLKPR